MLVVDKASAPCKTLGFGQIGCRSEQVGSRVNVHGEWICNGVSMGDIRIVQTYARLFRLHGRSGTPEERRQRSGRRLVLTRRDE